MAAAFVSATPSHRFLLSGAGTRLPVGVTTVCFHVCAWCIPPLSASQGTTGQNRTKQTRAQKQAKQTKTNKALFTEQAADFGMWQQSRAAYAGRRQIHAIMESTSRSYCYQSPWQGTANLQLVRTHMCTPTVGENDEKYDHFKVTLTYKRPAEK